ncbi:MULTISPECIES: ATP synthase subunit I [Bacillus]|uniref:ATP synthase subunit I n=1 Tax=Bacillus TaxID=1386 RepID=UPI00030B7C7C|nr:MULTISPECIES: ATP synthase subunit I [Bacillus]
MPDLQFLFKRQLKYTLYLIALYVLGWGFTDYQAIFAGLILGTSLSTFNQWLLVRRTVLVGKAAIKGKKVRTMGSAFRFATAILATLISVEYPEYFSIVGTILGLVTAYVVMIIVFFIHKSNSTI